MHVAVVGSGPTGVAAAHQLARRGLSVTVFDPGQRHEDEDFVAALADTVRAGRRPSRRDHRRLLGLDGPGAASEVLRQSLAVARGAVPARTVEKRILGSRFVFRNADEVLPVRGTWLPRSAATGGLANAWGAACYRLRADDWSDWELGAPDLAPWYREAEALLGVTGDHDALSTAYPAPDPLVPVAGPAARDPRSLFEPLLGRWARESAALAADGLALGRSRLAVRPPGGEATSCVRCGLCAMGCPTGAIWSPRPTLDHLVRGGVTHRPGHVVERIVEEADAVRIVARTGDVGSFDAAVLAAGALGSFAIAAAGLDVEARVSENDVAILPFAVRRLPVPRRPRFTLSEAVIAIDAGVVSTGPVHVQLYRASPGLLGPLGRLVGLAPELASRALGRGAATAVLGLVYLHGRDSRDLRARRTSDGLSVRTAGDSTVMEVVGRLSRLLSSQQRRTGLVPLPRLARPAPPGTSVHLCGTLSARAAAVGTDVDGRLRVGDAAPSGRVVVADHAALPEAPAQNLTLTGVANALRVSDLLATRLTRT